MTTPAWLGIGAQRSGTTWFTDLLTQHPDVGLGTNGKKEQHLLHKVGDGLVPASDYLELFPADGVRRGEWTPQYLRHASAPATAARLLGPDVPVLVLLRDPVERFLLRDAPRGHPGDVPVALPGADHGAGASAASTPTSWRCGRTTWVASGWW